MKRRLFSGTTGILALLFAAGCRVTVPAPTPDENAKPMPEPISYYGGIDVFEKKSSPLMVKVTAPAASDEISLAETMKGVLNKSNVNCVLPGAPCDIQISVDSAYKELTAAPQCRMSHLLTISVSSPDGVMLSPRWEHKTAMAASCSTAAEAKAKLRPQINETIREWGKNNFSNEVEKNLKASVLRVKMSRSLIELNPIRFEEELRTVLNRLRKIKGVVNVRMIEANKDTRIASFRILYRDDIFSKNRKQK